MGEVSAVAGDHGSQHDGVVLGEAQGRGQTAHGRRQGQEARAGGVLQTAQAAGEEKAGRRAETVNAIDGDGGRGGDALIEEKILAAPDARIVIDLRSQEAHHGADTFAALEWKRLGAGLGGSD